MKFIQTIKDAMLLSLWWIPRIFCIMFIIFLGTFSFDIFGQGSGISKSVSLFLFHNIPTLTVLAVLILSWKRSWLGSVCFIILAIVFFFWQSDIRTSLFTSLPLFILGLLYFLNWHLRTEISKARKN